MRATLLVLLFGHAVTMNQVRPRPLATGAGCTPRRMLSLQTPAVVNDWDSQLLTEASICRVSRHY